MPPHSASAHTWRRADTNVVSIKFDKLTAPSHMHTGDPVYCQTCKVVLSHISKLQPQGDEKVSIVAFHINLHLSLILIYCLRGLNEILSNIM